MVKVVDAVIVGAGVIGTAISYQLSSRGWRTLNVDKLAAAGQGSTSSSLAIVRTNYSTREGCALAWEGYHHWIDWPAYLNQRGSPDLAKFIPTGALALKTDQNNQLARQIELSEELKIPYEEWSPQEIAKRFPNWDIRTFGPPVPSEDPQFGISNGRTIHGAVYFPKAGYCSDPRLAAQNLQKASESIGGSFQFQRNVENIRIVNNNVVGVKLNDGTQIDSPVVVNAAGPHSKQINELLGIEFANITTRAIRHESIHLPLPHNCQNETSNMVVFDNDVGDYTRPNNIDSIFVGSQGTNFDHDETVDPSDFQRNLSSAAKEPVYRLAQRIPALGIPNTLTGIVDLWDVTDDWIPIYDCSDISGYYLAIGTSGNQFKSAPVVGSLMAELIIACQNGRKHDLKPITFLLERTGINISLDFFSRNRKINTLSSFSVLG